MCGEQEYDIKIVSLTLEENQTTSCIIDKQGRFMLVEQQPENKGTQAFKLYNLEKIEEATNCSLVLVPDIEALAILPDAKQKAAGFITGSSVNKGILLMNGAGFENVSVYDLESGSLIKALTGHKKAPASAAFSQDGLWAATGGYTNEIILWDTETFSNKAVITLSGGQFKLLALYSDGTVLVQKSFGGYMLYNMNDSSLVHEFRRTKDIPEDFITFIDNGKKLISWSGFKICNKST